MPGRPGSLGPRPRTLHTEPGRNLDVLTRPGRGPRPARLLPSLRGHLAVGDPGHLPGGPRRRVCLQSRGPGRFGGDREDAGDRPGHPGGQPSLSEPAVPHPGRVHGDPVRCTLLRPAREAGLRRAMRLAFRTGGVAGMFTVGLGLLGATAILIIYKQDATSVLVGFGFGGALLAMFMRVGGGIFTKAADVGADLVGKVEKNIPEDDPRNAATIADNVGDNVGDCAGMAADLFESYEVTLVASIILGAAAFAGSKNGAIVGIMFPLFVRAIGVITSMIGIMAVTPRSEDEHGMRAINRGFFLSAAASAVGVFLLAHFYAKDIRVFWAVLFGLVLASIIQLVTEHFTSTTRKPVQEVAESSQTGAATTILSGFSVGLESTVWSILVIGAVIVASFYLGDNIAER